jgi:undecaprenyl-diphosphatase
MFLLGGLVFGALAYNLDTHGPLLQWDAPVDNSLHAEAISSPVYIKDLMIAGFYVGKQVVSAIGILLGLYFLYKRFWRELAMVALGFGGAGLIWWLLSNYFNRPRPVFNPPLWMIIPGGGFPSGHTISAVVCYGLLAYLWVPKLYSRFWKGVVIVAAVAIMIFIGYSRLFLGEHFLTDILAGYALGILWAGLAYTAIELIFRSLRQ